MTVCAATLNNMAAHYASLGAAVGVATANPGATATPIHEATGGTPAYVRRTCVWSADVTGVQVAAEVTVDVPPGRYTYMILASATTGNNQIDNCSMSTIVVPRQGTIVVAPTYIQT